MNKVEKLKPKITTITKVIQKRVYTDPLGTTYDNLNGLRSGLLQKLYNGKLSSEFGIYNRYFNIFNIYSIDQINNWYKYFNVKIKYVGIYAIRCDYTNVYKPLLVFDLRDVS